MTIDKGMPIEQVQHLSGHVRIDTTLQYAIVNQNNVKIAHKRYLGWVPDELLPEFEYLCTQRRTIMANGEIVKPEAPETTKELVHDACIIIEQAQKSAYCAVNETLIKRNWFMRFWKSNGRNMESRL